MAIGQAAHNLRTKLEEAGAENVVAELLVLEQRNDNAEQAKDAAASDQATGVKRAGTDFISGGGSAAAFHQPAHHATGENGHGCGDGKICAGGKGQGANAEQFHSENEKDSQQHEPPGKLAVEYAVDDCGHQPGLRRGGFVAADALHPLNLDALGIGIVEVFAVGYDARTERVDERIGLALVDVIRVFHLHTGGQLRDV